MSGAKKRTSVSTGADILSKMGRKLHYYHKDSGLKIDFIARYKGKATIIEIKTVSGQAKSARTILNHPEKYHVSQCIKPGSNCNAGRAGEGNPILTLPLYMGFLLSET